MATGAVGDRTAHAQHVVEVEFKQDTELVANLHQRMEENLALDSTKWSESATRINVPQMATGERGVDVHLHVEESDSVNATTLRHRVEVEHAQELPSESAIWELVESDS